jgi:hypothetical protein
VKYIFQMVKLASFLSASANRRHYRGLDRRTTEKRVPDFSCSCLFGSTFSFSGHSQNQPHPTHGGLATALDALLLQYAASDSFASGPFLTTILRMVVAFCSYYLCTILELPLFSSKSSKAFVSNSQFQIFPV